MAPGTIWRPANGAVPSGFAAVPLAAAATWAGGADQCGDRPAHGETPERHGLRPGGSAAAPAHGSAAPATRAGRRRPPARPAPRRRHRPADGGRRDAVDHRRPSMRRCLRLRPRRPRRPSRKPRPPACWRSRTIRAPPARGAQRRFGRQPAAGARRPAPLPPPAQVVMANPGARVKLVARWTAGFRSTTRPGRPYSRRC